jgi:hypothetical protein
VWGIEAGSEAQLNLVNATTKTLTVFGLASDDRDHMNPFYFIPTWPHILCVYISAPTTACTYLGKHRCRHATSIAAHKNAHTRAQTNTHADKTR